MEIVKTVLATAPEVTRSPTASVSLRSQRIMTMTKELINRSEALSIEDSLRLEQHPVVLLKLSVQWVHS